MTPVASALQHTHRKYAVSAASAPLSRPPAPEAVRSTVRLTSLRESFLRVPAASES